MRAREARKEAKRARRRERRRLRFTDRHAAVRGMVALIRADWIGGETPTMLNHEGALVAILRAELCLRSLPWPLADHEAREAVREAVRAAGAKRPSWQEGQPEWTDGGVIRDTRTLCANCERPLPEGHKVFCSPMCGNAARARRWWHDQEDAQRIQRNLDRKRRHHAAQS